MKSSSLTTTKDTEGVSLTNLNNYFNELTCESNVVNDKYTKLLDEYLNFAKEKVYSNFVLLRGVDTITNVFLMVLFYTKNLDLTYYQCQKSFYYFLEFISQITEDQHIYLQLSCKDAITYVYKKTIYEISNEYKKNIKQPSPSSQEKLDLINKFIQINKMILYGIINIDRKASDDDAESLKLFVKLSNKLNIDKIGLDDLNICSMIIERFIPDLSLISLYLKKVSKNLPLIKKSKAKLFDIEFIKVQTENDNEKFISWLIN
jgi:hypothetical protein